MQTGSNRFEVSGQLIGRDALRYTPAGIAMLNGRLAHRSEQTEAGLPRSVEFEMDLLFAGEVAVRAERLQLGVGIQAAGFITPRRKTSKTLLLHVTDYELIPLSAQTSNIDSN